MDAGKVGFGTPEVVSADLGADVGDVEIVCVGSLLAGPVSMGASMGTVLDWRKVRDLFLAVLP